MYHSITIGDRNTWDYWHLLPTSRPLVNPPEVKAQLVEVPGRSGFIDLSIILTGYMTYGSRQGSWTFIAHPDYHYEEPWNTKYQSIMKYLHGKTHRVVLEDDPFYYYEGLLKVNQWQSGANWSQVTIDYTFQPYKKEIITSSENWLWDPFSFVDGIIRSYSSIRVSGDPYILEIKTGDEPVVPVFTAEELSEDSVGTGEIPPQSVLKVVFNGNEYSLPMGEQTTIKQIKLQGDTSLTFTGRGLVTVDFRAGWL